MFLKLAKDELQMKETMVASSKESATQTSKVMGKIAESISSFGKALGDGLAMIAIAMAPPQWQQVPSAPQASRMQMFSSHLQAHIRVRSRLLTCLTVLDFLFMVT